MFAIKMYYVSTTDNIRVIGFGAVQPHTITKRDFTDARVAAMRVYVSW